MISQIAIRGFQSLQAVTLDLGNITVVVGHSDAGKSALLRAIEHAAFNVAGNTFLTNIGGQIVDKAQVAIKTESGIVIWERTKSTVKYRLLVNGQERTFTKLGRSYVPEEIISILGIRPISVDIGAGSVSQHRIQFSGQFDQPFLVVDRGGVAAARILGRLTGVHIYSQAARLLTSKRGQLTESVNNCKKQVEEKKQNLKSYINVSDKFNQLQDLRKRIVGLRVKQTNLLALKQIQSKYRATASLINSVSDIDARIVLLDTLATRFTSLWRSLANLMRASNMRRTYQPSVIKQIGELPTVPSTKWKQYQDLIKFRVVWQQHQERNKKIAFTISELEKQHSSSELQLEEINAKYPLCPFETQFDTQVGHYRCIPIMDVIRKRSQ